MKRQPMGIWNAIVPRTIVSVFRLLFVIRADSRYSRAPFFVFSVWLDKGRDSNSQRTEDTLIGLIPFSFPLRDLGDLLFKSPYVSALFS